MSDFSSTTGARLREERLRLGLSQAELAAIGGLQQRAQLNYESGARSPDAGYLQCLMGIGVDVVYVLTGQRAVAVLSEDEGEILGAYRQLGEAGKAFIQQMLANYVNDGSLTADGQPASAERRVKRLSENRRAALDERTAENVDKAMELVEQVRKARAPRKPKGEEES